RIPQVEIPPAGGSAPAAANAETEDDPDLEPMREGAETSDDDPDQWDEVEIPPAGNGPPAGGGSDPTANQPNPPSENDPQEQQDDGNDTDYSDMYTDAEPDDMDTGRNDGYETDNEDLDVDMDDGESDSDSDSDSDAEMDDGTQPPPPPPGNGEDQEWTEEMEQQRIDLENHMMADTDYEDQNGQNGQGEQEGQIHVVASGEDKQVQRFLVNDPDDFDDERFDEAWWDFQGDPVLPYTDQPGEDEKSIDIPPAYPEADQNPDEQNPDEPTDAPPDYSEQDLNPERPDSPAGSLFSGPDSDDEMAGPAEGPDSPAGSLFSGADSDVEMPANTDTDPVEPAPDSPAGSLFSGEDTDAA
ncbi:hypothetical protein QBC35DRAFT_452222, partial [Podospora australis]